jgi:hypothetical protein
MMLLARRLECGHRHWVATTGRYAVDRRLDRNENIAVAAPRAATRTAKIRGEVANGLQ